MKRNLLISFVLLLFTVTAMIWQGTSLISPQSQRGIIDFEFARTTERVHQLRFFWNHEAVLRNIYFYVLLGCVSAWFLVTACKLSDNSRTNLFSALAISAAAFHLLENFLMILVWNQRFDPSVLQMVFFAALIKYVLFALVIGYLVLSLFGLFRKESSL